MSFEWFRWAMSQRNLRPPEKAVLVCIANYYNDKDGCAWPSQETIAKDTCYNRATVHRACKTLNEKGLLSWKKIMLPSGHFSSNRYQLHLVADSQAAECVAAEKDGAMLHKATTPCSTAQQKPLTEPLRSTLNTYKEPEKKPSKNQKKFAEKLTERLIRMHPNQHYLFEHVYRDCCDFLVTNQTEEDWIKLGNGLPNPLNI